MHVRHVGLVLITAALGACAFGRLGSGAAEGESVEVEGWAALDAKDPLGAKERSLIEAQRKAVEQVLGVYISAKARVAQAIELDQNILAKVSGYIKKYQVLSEKKESGFYKTRIRAFVLYKKVGDDLKSLGLLKGPVPGNPKVVVLVGTRGQWSEGSEGRASSAVRRSFVEHGFSVIDRSDPMAFGSRKSTEAASALRAGLELGADLVVKGEAEAYPIQDSRLVGFFSYRARVQLEALKAGTGEVLAQRVQEASALDPSPGIAQGKALENAGFLAGESLSQALTDAMKSRTNVALRVLGISGLAAVQGLAEDLRLMPEVEGVALSEYRPEGAELAVTTLGVAGDELAALILRMRKYPFTVRGVTPYVVEVSVSDAP